MENHGYEIMDLVEEVRYEKARYEFALKCKTEWYIYKPHHYAVVLSIKFKMSTSNFLVSTHHSDEQRTNKK